MKEEHEPLRSAEWPSERLEFEMKLAEYFADKQKMSFLLFEMQYRLEMLDKQLLPVEDVLIVK